MSKLEHQYKQLNDADISNFPDNVNILVLGAGHTDDRKLSPNNRLSTTALGRLIEAVRLRNTACKLGHKANGIKIIMSGYSGRSSESQAIVLYRTALILGLDSTEMDISPNPSNTVMEADEYLQKFGPETTLVIVTSAIHMPRAIKIFSDKGIRILPAPTNFIIKNGTVKNPLRWLPASKNISMMEQAMHEYVGLFWYRIQNKLAH